MPYLTLPIVLSCIELHESGLWKEKSEKTLGPSPAFEMTSSVTLRNAFTYWNQFLSL